MTDDKPSDVIEVPADVDVDALLKHMIEGGPLPPGVTHVPYEVWTARGRVEDCDCKLIQCVCATARLHEETCFWRKSLTCAVPFPCDPHGDDTCPECYPCTCKVRPSLPSE